MKTIYSLLWFPALFWALLATAADKPKKDDDAPKEPSGTGLFEEVKVINIRLEMSKAAIDGLQKSYSNSAVYVSAKFEANGRLFERVGVHLRGVSTFQTVDKKPNFTVKFNEYVPGQFFHGLRKIRLSNGQVDRSYLQEFLAAELFRSAGVATPRVNYARVWLNGRELGLYLLIEGIGKEFLKENYHSTEGNLYEGDEADLDEHLEQDYGKRTRHRTDLQQVMQAIKEPDLRKRFELMEKVLDMESFISHVAVEVLIDDWDGYSMRINNYRVWCDHQSGKATFIPHGLDNTWADAEGPLLPELKGKVSRALLETPEGQRRYLARMGVLHRELLKKEVLLRRLRDVAAKFKPVLAELGKEKLQERSFKSLEQKIEKRIEFVAKQLPIEAAKSLKKNLK